MKKCTVAQLIAMLQAHPPELEVIISTQDENSVPISAEVEHDHGDDSPFLRLYADNGADG